MTNLSNTITESRGCCDLSMAERVRLCGETSDDAIMTWCDDREIRYHLRTVPAPRGMKGQRIGVTISVKNVVTAIGRTDWMDPDVQFVPPTARAKAQPLAIAISDAGRCDGLHGDEDYREDTFEEVIADAIAASKRLRELDWLTSDAMGEVVREIEAGGYTVEYTHDIVEVWGIDPHGGDYVVECIEREEGNHDEAVSILWSVATGEPVARGEAA